MLCFPQGGDFSKSWGHLSPRTARKRSGSRLPRAEVSRTEGAVLGTHGDREPSWRQTPPGSGDPIITTALLSPPGTSSELPATSKPASYRGPERAGVAAKQLQKVMQAQESPPRPAKGGPTSQEACSGSATMREGKSVPKSDIPRDTPGAGRFYWEGIHTHSLPGGSGHGAPAAAPHRRGGGHSLGPV